MRIGPGWHAGCLLHVSSGHRPIRRPAGTRTVAGCAAPSSSPSPSWPSSQGPRRRPRRRRSPGSAGLGDRLFPTLGNGGYDVLHYDLDLRYATAAPSQPIDGTVTILARATQSLSRFDLDFAGRQRRQRRRQRRSRRRSRRDGEELVITPRKPLRKGVPFVVTVSHYTAVPTVPDPDDLATTAFFITPDGSATAGQPNLAHDFLPSNDHPRDKATFDIRFDVPAGETAVANGVLAGALDRARAHALRLRAAPADGDRADPARGRQLRRDRPSASTPASCCATSPRAPITARLTPLLPLDPGADRLDGGRGRRATRSTSTARSWSRPTSASRWRRRRSS